VPHAGDHRDAQPSRRAVELGSAVRAQLESFHEGPLGDQGSFADDGGSGIQITAIKGTEDATGGPGGADLIVRAVETRGETTDAAIELPLVGRRIEARFEPYRIRTFRVPREGDIVEVDLLELPVES
jgi:alpha-mannosidase